MEELVQSFKALSHKNRLQIIRLLMENEHKCDHPGCTLENPICEFGELLDLLGIHKSTLSHHLKELKYAELIETKKEGRYVSVRVNREKIDHLKRFFEIETAENQSSFVPDTVNNPG